MLDGQEQAFDTKDVVCKVTCRWTERHIYGWAEREPTPIGACGVPICLACKHYTDDEPPCEGCKYNHVREWIRDH